MSCDVHPAVRDFSSTCDDFNLAKDTFLVDEPWLMDHGIGVFGVQQQETDYCPVNQEVVCKVVGGKFVVTINGNPVVDNNGNLVGPWTVSGGFIAGGSVQGMSYPTPDELGKKLDTQVLVEVGTAVQPNQGNFVTEVPTQQPTSLPTITQESTMQVVVPAETQSVVTSIQATTHASEKQSVNPDFESFDAEDVPDWAIVLGAVFIVVASSWMSEIIENLRARKSKRNDVPDKVKADALQDEFDKDDNLEERYMAPVVVDQSISGNKYDPVLNAFTEQAGNYPEQLRRQRLNHGSDGGENKRYSDPVLAEIVTDANLAAAELYRSAEMEPPFEKINGDIQIQTPIKTKRFR